MQIVIEIDEENYEKNKYGRCPVAVMRKSIRNGTPLPKGHGRLIDADELKKHKYHDSNRFENAVAVAQIDWSDTIIEADKEEQDE